MLNASVYIALCVFAMTPWSSSATALVLGILVSLGLQLKPPSWAKPASRNVMQVAIVMMGFAMDPVQVIASGREGILITLVSLLLALGIGKLLALAFKVERDVGFLISAGTGICGGSAISSLSPIMNAKDEDVAISLACVFCLNAVALILFPEIGRYFSLTPEQFGWFAAIAIHDTSSVVGAASEFDSASLTTAVTAKLTRALWIIPMMFALSALLRYRNSKGLQADSAKVKWPIFIFVFIGCVALHGVLPDMPVVYGWFETSGRALLKVAIFLTGTQLTRSIVHRVGPRSFAQATCLWLVMLCVTLLWVRTI
jgi:uncharacterized integral membrane protein (TIGR00698 family)